LKTWSASFSWGPLTKNEKGGCGKQEIKKGNKADKRGKKGKSWPRWPVQDADQRQAPKPGPEIRGDRKKKKTLRKKKIEV